ncbi:hypothetical protein Lser_V15G29099 [Lactuca serriola]
MAFSFSKSAQESVSNDYLHLIPKKMSTVEQEELSKYIKNYKCIACRLNLSSDVEYGQRSFMADCGICKRVSELRGRMVNRETYKPPAGTLHQTPSVNLNLTLATTVDDEQTPSASSKPPPKFIDFLGVGSV